MSCSHSSRVLQSPRIDHFSSLPNELLDHIFDYAHESSPPRAPLSKHLRPFFERGLYRKVSLSVISLPPFLDTVLSSPRLGRMVKNLTLPETGNRRLAELLPLVPNIVDLDVPSLSPLPLSSSPTPCSKRTLSHLQCIAVSFEPGGGSTTDIDGLAQLAELPSLWRLKVYAFNKGGTPTFFRSPSTIIPQITQLTIERVAADLAPVKFIVDSCPSLLHLELYCTYRERIEFDYSLPHLPNTLQSLHLHCSGIPATPFDHLLSRFSHLRSIRLGNRCYTSTIHSVLLQLPLLTHIHLGSSPLDFVNLRSLVTGPTRLLCLKTITLDSYVCPEGERSQRPSEIIRASGEEVDGFDIEMSDWDFPAEWNGATLNVGDYEEFERLAKENGIVVNGTIKDAIDWCRNFHLELNNRAVLDAYNRQDFTRLRRIRSSAAQTGGLLPNIDFDSLDIIRLEIVETDLPERGWWVLSLMNRGQSG